MHPILVEFGRFRLFSYGVLIAFGGALCCRFWHSRRARMGISREEDFWLFVNVILAGGFIGGRALFLVEYTKPLSSEFWQALFAFSRGFSVMGAFFGVCAGLWWFCRRSGAPLLGVLDYVCQAAPFWHFFGRVGCFLAGCCFGRPTDLPWGVTFRDPRAMVDPALLGRPLHPAQLYEAFLDLALAAALYRFVLRGVEEGRYAAGSVCAAYFAGYAIIRFITEFYRGDVVRLGMGLTAAQGISVFFLAGAGALYWRIRSRPLGGSCSPS